MESSENPGTPPEEKSWVKIYPIYMDSKVKYSEGRKIKLDLCPETPTAKEIYTVCFQTLNLICKMEQKSHPKDWEKRGRVVVKLKGEDGKLVSGVPSEAKTKRGLLKIIALNVKNLQEKNKVEIVKPEEEKKKRRKKKK